MLRVYPPQPAKQWAAFAILSYEEYEKLGKYGDEKQDRFAFLPEEQSDAVAAAVASLQVNDRVRLSWRHEIVTRTDPEGRSSSVPERPVATLEKL